MLSKIVIAAEREWIVLEKVGKYYLLLPIYIEPTIDNDGTISIVLTSTGQKYLKEEENYGLLADVEETDDYIEEEVRISLLCNHRIVKSFLNEIHNLTSLAIESKEDIKRILYFIVPRTY